MQNKYEEDFDYFVKVIKSSCPYSTYINWKKFISYKESICSNKSNINFVKSFIKLLDNIPSSREITHLYFIPDLDNEIKYQKDFRPIAYEKYKEAKKYNIKNSCTFTVPLEKAQIIYKPYFEYILNNNKLYIKINELSVSDEYIIDFYNKIKNFYMDTDCISIDISDCPGGTQDAVRLFLSIFSSKRIIQNIKYYFSITKYNKQQLKEQMKINYMDFKEKQLLKRDFLKKSTKEVGRKDSKIPNTSYSCYQRIGYDLGSFRITSFGYNFPDYNKKIIVLGNDNVSSVGGYFLYLSKLLGFQIKALLSKAPKRAFEKGSVKSPQNEKSIKKYIGKTAWGPGRILDVLPNTKLLFNYDAMISKENIIGMPLETSK